MRIDYHDRLFRSLANTPNGDVGDDTRFHYRQQGDIVWATYEGGQVTFGTLVAKVLPGDELDMRYHHVSRDGTIKAGRCHSKPIVLADGRIRLREEWTWTEGGDGHGVSLIEEIAREG